MHYSDLFALTPPPGLGALRWLFGPGAPTGVGCIPPLFLPSYPHRGQVHYDGSLTLMPPPRLGALQRSFFPDTPTRVGCICHIRVQIRKFCWPEFSSAFCHVCPTRVGCIEWLLRHFNYTKVQLLLENVRDLCLFIVDVYC